MTSTFENTTSHPRVVAAVAETPWAITRPMLHAIAVVTARIVAGRKLEPLELDEAVGERVAHRQPIHVEYEVSGARGGARRAASSGGVIAVLPLYGVMGARLSLMQAMSGGTSVETYMGQIKAALNDDSVSSILLDIDSPGGSVDLVAELGQLILDGRGEKPIAAIANTCAASAAYWVAAQADELAVTPSGQVGSIGVYSIHEDLSKALELEGVDLTIIQAGKFKTEMHPYGPLSDEAHAYAQGVVDDYYGMFKDAVAKGRGVSAGTVESDFGQGRMLIAKRAQAAGMVDRVATYDQMLARLARGQVAAGKPGRLSAAVPTLRLDAAEDTDPAPDDAQAPAGTAPSTESPDLPPTGDPGDETDASTASAEPVTDSPAPAGDAPQAARDAGLLLHRRAVRAALRPAALAPPKEEATR